jgi:hypothetical protein
MSYCKAKYCRYSSSHTTAGHQCGNCHNYGHGQLECKQPQNLSLYLDEIMPIHLQCQVIGCKHSKLHTTESHISTRYDELVYEPVSSKWKIDLKESEHSVKCPLCRIKNTYTDIESLKVYGITQKCVICADNEIGVILTSCKHVCLCMNCLKQLSIEETKEEKVEVGNDEYQRTLAKAIQTFGNRTMVWTYESVGQGCVWYFRRTATGITESFFLHGDNHGQYGSETNDIPRLQIFLTGYSRIN